MQHPPVGVKLVIEAVCIMKEVKPKRVAGEKVGTKVDDYWEPGKALLQNPERFLESLFKYDRDNIPDAVITKIQPYIDNEDFTPAAISKVHVYSQQDMFMMCCFRCLEHAHQSANGQEQCTNITL